MSEYRAPGIVGGPLFVLQRPFLRAIEAKTGALLWEHKIKKPIGVGRIFLQEERVLVAMGPNLHCFEAKSGKELGVVELGFTPEAGLVHEGRLILAGKEELTCLASDGAILWTVLREGWAAEMTCRGAGGAELWKRPPGSNDSRAAPGLAIDGIVVQPDRPSSSSW
jgi:hypothetical protein